MLPTCDNVTYPQGLVHDDDEIGQALFYSTSYSTFSHNVPSDKSSSVIIYGMGIPAPPFLSILNPNKNQAPLYKHLTTLIIDRRFPSGDAERVRSESASCASNGGASSELNLNSTVKYGNHLS